MIFTGSVGGWGVGDRRLSVVWPVLRSVVVGPVGGVQGTGSVARRVWAVVMVSAQGQAGSILRM